MCSEQSWQIFWLSSSSTQAQLILANCQIYFYVHSQSLKAVLAMPVFPKVFSPVKGDCHEFGLNHALHKQFRNKMQMEMETPRLVSGTPPHLFYLNWRFNKNPKVDFLYFILPVIGSITTFTNLLALDNLP